jgi:two-component system, NtrC family, sensor histidine kinase HydH
MAIEHRSAGRWSQYAIGIIAIAVAATALSAAIGWYRHPFAGLLVDANALVSNLGHSDWDGHRQGLIFPHQIVEVEGVSLRTPGGGMRPAAFDQAVERAYRQGASTVRVQVQTQTGTRSVDLRVEPFEPASWWIFAGGLFFAASLFVIAALIALWASPKGKLARSFTALAAVSGLFMFTVFDFHTSRELVPLFYLAFAVAPVGYFFLPLRLPDDAPILRRFPWLEGVAYALSACVGVFQVVTYWRGESTTVVQSVLSMLLGVSFIFFVSAILVRFFRAHGRRRAILGALIVAMVPPYALIGGVGLLLPSLDLARETKIVTESLAFPALSLAPLAIAYAFVRHNLFGSRELLSRILTNVLVGLVVCVLAVGLATELAAQLGAPFAGALIAATFAGLSAGVAVPIALRWTERTLFRARAAYKPSIDQLSEELTAITSPEEVARALERTVRRWLPCDSVQVVLTDPSNWLTAQERMPRESGVRELLEREGGDLELSILFAGKHLGDLHVGAKHGGALFTSDDFDLLRTIVNHGAVALAHAHAYQELEQRRKQQAAAWRGEREALVETVAAEIAHEVRYPINFFRMLFERAAGGYEFVPDDVELGRAEVDRLERLVAGLRRVASHRIERRPLALSELCARAELLLRDALADRRVDLEIDPRTAILCDADQATQVLVNLLSNALDAAGPDGSLGVRWTNVAGGSELVVWDNGTGFVGDPGRLFAPWFTTKSRGTGLGLAITQRLVRAHGWKIAAARAGDTTTFTISIPSTDITTLDATTLPRRTEEAKVA